jgi:hypothetical protein
MARLKRKEKEIVTRMHGLCSLRASFKIRHHPIRIPQCFILATKISVSRLLSIIILVGIGSWLIISFIQNLAGVRTEEERHF